MEADERDNLLVWVDVIMIFFVGMRFFHVWSYHEEYQLKREIATKDTFLPNETSAFYNQMQSRPPTKQMCLISKIIITSLY